MNTPMALRRWVCLFGCWPALVHAQFQLLVGEEDDEILTALGRPVQLSDGGVLAVLRQNGESSLLRTSAAGQPQWCANYTHNAAHIYALASATVVAREDGGAVVLFPGQEEDMVAHFMVARLDVDGQVQWSRTYALDLLMPGAISMLLMGAAHADGSVDILLTNAGGPGLTYLVRLNAQGDVLWARRSPHDHSPTAGYSAPLMTAGAAGDVFIQLQRSSAQAGYLSRIGPGGETIWGRSLRMTNGAWFYQNASIALDQTGGLYLGGFQELAPVYKQYLLHVNATGDLSWYRWVGDGWFDLELWPSIGRVQNGQVQLGGGLVRFTCGLDGTGVERRVYALQSFTSGPYAMSFNVRSPERTGDDLLITGSLRRTDASFGYMWNHPLLMRMPLDLPDACLLDLTTDTAADTLVPSAYLENVTEPDWLLATCTSTLAELQRVEQPLPGTMPLCGQVGLPEQESVASMRVWPTVLAAGEPCHVVLDRPARLHLRDALGRSWPVATALATDHVVDTQALVPGSYLVQGVDESGHLTATHRLVVHR